LTAVIAAGKKKIDPRYAMFCPMQERHSPVSIICQFFLVFTFLCAPIADSLHAVKMSQTGHAVKEGVVTVPAEKIQLADALPCHEAMLVSQESSVPDQAQSDHSGAEKPCCPHKQCSPKNCLMHFAIASMPMLEIISHSPIDPRVFLDANVHLVLLPFTEQLRPPIA
jgi:hypothetical protein